jgi:hypothetical protein
MIPLLTGERITLRRGRQTAGKTILLDPMVFLRVVVRLALLGVVLATSFPLAAASVPIVFVPAMWAAAPWSLGQCNLPCWLNRFSSASSVVKSSAKTALDSYPIAAPTENTPSAVSAAIRLATVAPDQ